MRRLGWALSLFLSAATVAAQQPALLFVHEEIVKPSMVAEYESTTKELGALLRAADIPFHFDVSSSDDFHYYFFLPMKSFGEIDRIMQTFMVDLPKAAGAEKFGALMRRGGATMQFTRDWVLVRRDDLSYVPATPRLAADQITHAQYDFYFLQPGTEEVVDSIANDWKAAMKAANINHGFTVYQAAVGGDLPLVIVVTHGTSVSDLLGHASRTEKALGDKARPLLAKTFAPVRKFERKYVRYRPDLANPAPAAAAK